MKKRLLILVILAMLVSACGSGETATVAPEPSEVPEAAATSEPEPTQAPEATATPKPEPTQTPEPTPYPIPPGRGLHQMAFDAESGQVIIFGGGKENGRYFRDTWAYDLNANIWKQMRPATSPGKGDGTMVYDAESDRVILFFGSLTETGHYYDLAPASETWVYDFNANTWTNMTPAEAPFGPRGTRMVYDTESDRMILFGGLIPPGGGAFNETWAYDYNSNTWTMMGPEVSPPGRQFHGMAYDAGSDRVILWGGGGSVLVDVSNVWAYDYNADTWEELESSGAPSPVQNAAMVYDAATDRSILYVEEELWAFDYDANLWTLLSNSPAPGKLQFHTTVYSSELNQVILFGGGPNVGLVRDKTWVYDYDTNTWTDMTRR